MRNNVATTVLLARGMSLLKRNTRPSWFFELYSPRGPDRRTTYIFIYFFFYAKFYIVKYVNIWNTARWKQQRTRHGKKKREKRKKKELFLSSNKIRLRQKKTNNRIRGAMYVFIYTWGSRIRDFTRCVSLPSPWPRLDDVFFFCVIGHSQCREPPSFIKRKKMYI